MRHNIDFKDESGMRSSSLESPTMTSTSNQSQNNIKDISNNNNDNESLSVYKENNSSNDYYSYNNNNNNNNNYLNAILRAKNIIAFFRALNEGYFRNIDPSYFVVISDGKLIGTYENEEIARQVAASQTNCKIGNQVGDGMVFPISGNFKSRKSSNDNRFNNNNNDNDNKIFKN